MAPDRRDAGTGEREPPPAVDWRSVGSVALAGCSLTLMAWVIGGWSAAVVLAVATACAAQGMVWGGLQLAGMLVGTVLALLLAGPIAPVLDALVAGALGTSGLQTRMLSLALAMVGITLVVALPAGWAVRRWMRGRGSAARWNGWLGAALGSVEGVILGMALLWVPLALEPVARARIHAERGPDGGGGVADGGVGAAGMVARLAQAVRESRVGPLATATSPLAGSELLALAEAYAAVSRSERAMRAFLDHGAMRELETLPSVIAALARLKQDPALRGLFERGSAVSAETLMAIVQSDVVLEVLDEGSLVRDLSPRVGAIREALEAARRFAEAGD